MQNTEETFAKYAVDTNLFRLGSTNPKKINPAPGFFFLLLYQGLFVGGAFDLEPFKVFKIAGTFVRRWLGGPGCGDGREWLRFVPPEKNPPLKIKERKKE